MSDSDDAPDEGVDPDDMKNHDPDEGPRSRRDLGATDEDEVDGRELADDLYGRLDDDSPKFEEGDRVAYLADHKDEYKDASAIGTVTEVRDEGVLVDYSDGSPSAKLTPRRNLHKLDSDE